MKKQIFAQAVLFLSMLPLAAEVGDAGWYTQIQQGITQPQQAQSEEKILPHEANAIEGLKFGDSGERVKVLQEMLLKWCDIEGLKVTGVYDENTKDGVSYFQKIFGLRGTGKVVNKKTAERLDEVIKKYRTSPAENHSGLQPQPAAQPGASAGRILLREARKFEGTPYDQTLSGADGYSSTDCGMLTRLSAINAGIADESFSRLADDQYYYAEHGQKNMTLVSEPEPGDFVFFNWHTSQSWDAYKGVTHVAFFVGWASEGCMKVYHAGYYEGVTEAEICTDRIAGFGRMSSR